MIDMLQHRTDKPEPAVPEPVSGWGGAADAVSALVNLAMLAALNLWPGWEVLPFLTDDFTRALPLVNLSLAAGALAGIVYLVAGYPVVRAWGGLVTLAIGLAAAVRLLQVFPVDGGTAVTVTARVLLVLAVAGSAIGIVAQLPAAVRAVRGAGRSGSAVRGGRR
jgi:hypothetical protein